MVTSIDKSLLIESITKIFKNIKTCIKSEPISISYLKLILLRYLKYENNFDRLSRLAELLLIYNNNEPN